MSVHTRGFHFAVIAGLWVASAGCLWSQRLSLGFVGGTNLTRDFPAYRTEYFDPAYPAGLTTFDLYSDTNSFIAGFSIEYALSARFSVKANALHRRLTLKRRYLLPDGQRIEDGQTSIGTWQWPVLFKYTVPGSRIRPFLEAGPSFRTRHQQAPGEPSQIGATVGAGVQVHAGRIRISPSIRFTRWAYDGASTHFPTRRDQLEFLTEVSYATSPSTWSVGGRRISFGAVAGVPLTGGLNTGSEGRPAVSELQGYTAGLRLGVRLNSRLSVGVDGLYRPFRADNLGYGADGSVTRQEFTVLTWQLPVLARANLRQRGTFSPVIEAGPSFRLSGNLNGYNPSSFGITAGVGVEAQTGPVRTGSVMRYTRWVKDESPAGRSIYPLTKPDQLELLFSFMF